MQKDNPILDRPNLSEDIATTLRAMVFDGRLAAGDRINEVHLAAQLGVSRTPLREALVALVAEGALISVPRLGYFVRELTIEEAKSIYPIRAILDPEALKLAGIPSPDRLDQLDAINDQLGNARDVMDAINLDDAWHRGLWSECPNPVLTELIEQFMRRTRRYELASMRDRNMVSMATKSHADTVTALREGKLSGACAILRRSLKNGARPVLDWLAQRKPNDSSKARS